MYCIWFYEFACKASGKRMMKMQFPQNLSNKVNSTATFSRCLALCNFHNNLMAVKYRLNMTNDHKCGYDQKGHNSLLEMENRKRGRPAAMVKTGRKRSSGEEETEVKGERRRRAMKME